VQKFMDEQCNNIDGARLYRIKDHSISHRNMYHLQKQLGLLQDLESHYKDHRSKTQLVKRKNSEVFLT